MKIPSIFKRSKPTSSVDYVLVPSHPVCHAKTTETAKIVARVRRRPKMTMVGIDTSLQVVSIFINEVFIEELAEGSAACQFAIGQDFEKLYKRRLEVFRSAIGGKVKVEWQVTGSLLSQEE